MKKCPSCAKELADNASSCPHCGQKFSTGASITVAVIIGVVLGLIVLGACTAGL